jgi:hypothetical protein
MITGDVTYSGWIASVFVSRILNIIDNIEVCYLKSVKLKTGSLGGSEHRLCRPYVEKRFLDQKWV